MTTMDRNEFLRLGATLAAGMAFAPGGIPALAAAPDDSVSAGAALVLLNSRVYTVDHSQPVAEGFAVSAGRFVAVGGTVEMRAFIGRGTQVIDARGRTVVPGFIDAHCHPASSGLEEVRSVELMNLRSLDAIYAALRARAATTPPGEWVTAVDYDDTKVTGGILTRTGLDGAVSDHPVSVDRRGGHVAWFNTAAFGLAGITRDTPNPDGGAFDRDAGGELTGRVTENAVASFWKRVKAPPMPTRAQWQEGVRRIARKMSAAGITSVHDATTDADALRAYQDARAGGDLILRVYAMVMPDVFAALRTAGVRTGFGDDWLRVGGVKHFADGSVSARTMRMSTPYEGRPNDYGTLTITQAELDAAVAEVHHAGFQNGVHANGDVAIDMVLTAYERMLVREPRADARPRVEHCTLVTPEILTRMRALGAIPTPFATYLRAYGEKWPEYGEARLRRMFAHRSFLDAGIPVAGASDYSAGPFEPLMGIQSMVTRRDQAGHVWGANQRVTVAEALRIYTINGAHASFEEADKGSITAGKLADFVVLEADPHRVNPDAIERIRIVRTVVGGGTTYEAA
jgi:predicted amidohydrolase YtcJ